MKKPVAILLSGGLDSTSLMALAASEENPRLAISVDYGQRHLRELDAAAAVASHYDVDHVVLDLTGWGALLSGSALTDRSVDVPLGRYDASNMATTVVPNRNATFLMAAAGIAAAAGISEVWTAVHGGDHALYPDCRPDFIEAASTAASLGTGGDVVIRAPFVEQTKADIVATAHRLDAPLGLTWSCYKGDAAHCGECGTCEERRSAFREAGITDPTHYETSET